MAKVDLEGGYFMVSRKIEDTTIDNNEALKPLFRSKRNDVNTLLILLATIEHIIDE